MTRVMCPSNFVAQQRLVLRSDSLQALLKLDRRPKPFCLVEFAEVQVFMYVN